MAYFGGIQLRCQQFGIRCLTQALTYVVGCAEWQDAERDPSQMWCDLLDCSVADDNYCPRDIERKDGRPIGLLRVDVAEAAAKFGDVRIVAPDVEQSSMGAAITASRPLSFRKTPIKKFDAYRVNGTPSDCVALGLHLWGGTDWFVSATASDLHAPPGPASKRREADRSDSARD